jgi:hypothetical protein
MFAVLENPPRVRLITQVRQELQAAMLDIVPMPVARHEDSGTGTLSGLGTCAPIPWTHWWRELARRRIKDASWPFFLNQHFRALVARPCKWPKWEVGSRVCGWDLVVGMTRPVGTI